MKTKLFKPSSPLSNYIDNYMLVDIDWSKTTELANVWRLIPYGKVAMFFLYGDTWEYNFQGANAPMQRERRAFLVGPLVQPIWLRFTGRSRLIKIQFRSSGAQRFLPVNMEEFRNMPSLDLEAVWGNATHELLEQLEASPSDSESIEKLNSFLEKRLLPRQEHIDYVDYTIEQMKANNGNISIKGLEQKLGICTRQLQRHFLSKIGISPKEMSKLIRLNSAFCSLETDPSISLTNLSYEAGYYDQSHFYRDFKSLSGESPKNFFSNNSDELFVTHGANFVEQRIQITSS
ncbi:helix-turn-helix domain-containing protein [Aequorivita sp. SDUM287046]|uniref:Helix-turn-helix domain-containing protein n=1 Tax=Aequorivita aurantiaca TaxID=3053356 RepID=A0ABT8DJQ1_9FLAO|nr:AraC family transcriptional regulator [Aequorivita aurantiaca]MDN3724120.1 helix-turn-helix domain-containing protein [Aequorivita aurantiaca]